MDIVYSINLNNPGVRTLTRFLTRVSNMTPITYTVLLRTGWASNQIQDYITYCRSRNLIEIEKTVQGKGLLSKYYRLTARGMELLSILWHMEDISHPPKESA